MNKIVALILTASIALASLTGCATAMICMKANTMTSTFCTTKQNIHFQNPKHGKKRL